MGEIFERILVGVSGTESSRAAVEMAARLARLHRAQIVLVSVVDTGLSSEIARALGRSESDVLADMEANSRKYLRDAEIVARRLGVSTEAVLRRGTPYLEIADEAEVRRADLVVLGSTHVEGPHRLAIGRVLERVIEHVDCPVLVVRHRKQST